MPNKIKPKRSYTTNLIPRSEDLEPHELAVNWTDGKIFTKNASGRVLSLSVGSPGSLSLTAADISAASATHAHNYVQALNAQTGSLSIVAGSNVTVTTAANSITISAAGEKGDPGPSGGVSLGLVLALS
jgi:hypothetical protein